MSDSERLARVLGKLAARETAAAGGRVLRGGGPEALLAAIATEIGETILPRRLIFQAEGGAALHLAVANRRLQALLAPAPEGTAPDLEGRALPDAEDPGVAALREVALAAIGVARALTVRAEKIPGTLYASDIGVPANLLSRAWGTDTAAEEGEPAPEDIIDAFLAGLEGEALAWLRIAGEEVTGQGGDPGLLETMGEKAAVFLDGYFGRLETLFPGDPGLCAIAIAPADGWGPAVFFAEAGAESAFLAADPAGIAALTARWQRLIAG